jgi:hypothetical protein
MLRLYLLRTRRHGWVFYSENVTLSNATLHSSSHPHPSPHGLFQRVFVLLRKAALNKLTVVKNEINSAPPGVGIKGKAQNVIKKLEGYIHPTESILHTVLKSSTMQILMLDTHKLNNSNQHTHSSSSSDHRRITKSRRLMKVLMKQRINYHFRWSIANAVLLPFSALATILPGPNIFLAWNLYRLYCHIQAYRGASLFLLKHQKHELDYILSHPQSEDVSNEERLAQAFNLPGLVEYLSRLELHKVHKTST